MGDAEDFIKYKEDPRTACKYGSKCYQKNPIHINKYKHPPKETENGSSTAKQECSSRQNLGVIIEDCLASASGGDTVAKTLHSTVANPGSSTKHKHDTVSAEIMDVVSQGPSKKQKLNEDELNESASSDSSASQEMNTSTSCFSDSDTTEPKPKLQLKINAISDSETDKDSSKDSSSNSFKYDKRMTSNTQALNSMETDSSKNNVEANFDKKQFIKARFLVNMPSDFYDFWEFCKKLNKNSPLHALKDIGLILVGPFDVLAGKFNNTATVRTSEEYLLHWRYFYDPPEFQTVLKGDDSTGYHIGYFRDSPKELPIFLAYNYGKKEGIFTEIGDNIFAAVSLYLDNMKKTADPFKKMFIPKFHALINTEAKKLKLELVMKTKRMRDREKKVVTKTFNKIGLVVPYNRKTQLGYRELALPDRELKQLLDKIAKAAPEQKQKLLSDLQPVLTYASIATDECDFGTGLELGLNILSTGIETLNSTVANCLTNSYRLLDREEFALIAEAHMQNRKKGSCLSIL